MNKIPLKYYVFLDEINTLIKKNILKFKNINIIINTSDDEIRALDIELEIIKFAKKENIPFLLKNNFSKCQRYRANGIFIDSKNKKITKPMLLKKNFTIVGSAHNQIEYSNKKMQNCRLIMLSPIFNNDKYSENRVLNIKKFNQISLNWELDLCALGGINSNNLKKIKLTRSKAAGFKRFIFEPQIKKPACKLIQAGFY
jgi:thiamine-phosphate pyrophosphorylase